MKQHHRVVATTPVRVRGTVNVTVTVNSFRDSISVLTISVLQAYCALITEYGIPSNFVRKSTASLQIKI